MGERGYIGRASRVCVWPFTELGITHPANRWPVVVVVVVEWSGWLGNRTGKLDEIANRSCPIIPIEPRARERENESTVTTTTTTFEQYTTSARVEGTLGRTGGRTDVKVDVYNS